MYKCIQMHLLFDCSEKLDSMNCSTADMLLLILLLLLSIVIIIIIISSSSSSSRTNFTCKKCVSWQIIKLQLTRWVMLESFMVLLTSLAVWTLVRCYVWKLYAYAALFMNVSANDVLTAWSSSLGPSLGLISYSLGLMTVCSVNRILTR